MKCECGYQNSEGALVCARCGRPLAEPKKSGRKVLGILAVGATLVIAVLAFLLLRSAPEEQVIKAIDAIGTVSMSSGQAIEKAEEKYAKLDLEAQLRVSNKRTLDQARKEFDRQKGLIDDAIEAVDAIGQVTLDSETDIADARSAYDQAEPLDTLGSLKDAKDTLEAAEAEFDRLMNDQENILKKGMSEIDSAVSLILSGNDEQAHTNLLYYLSKLTGTARRQKFATAVVDAFYEKAQSQHSVGNDWMAMHLLDQREYYEDDCGSSSLSNAETLEDQIATSLSSQRPKNGAILDRTYGAGRNTIKITAGEYDTCVKLELVDNPEKYAIFYIRGNETAKFNILNGEYRIKYTVGPVWYGEDMLFGPDATYILLDQTIDPSGYSNSYATYWHEFTWTVSAGYGAAWGYQNMDPDAF